MPCIKCNSDFNLLNWKLKCIECEENHCSKCLSKQQGYALCEVCVILIKRPPIREELMDLKVKDLQGYLMKNKISTHGIVEKQELVELFYRHAIPVRYKKSTRKFPVTLGGSVPNLTARSQAYINDIRTNAEQVIYNTTRNIGRPQNPSYSFNSSPSRRPYEPRSPVYQQPPGQTPTQTQQHQPREQPSAPRFEQPRPPQYEQHLPPRSEQPPPRPEQPPQFNNSCSSTAQATTSTENANEQTSTSQPIPPPRKYPKLSDYESAENLTELSSKQLKELLSLNRVDYKGCVEKAELLEKAQRLWADDNRHKNEDFTEVTDECCKICMDGPLDCVLLECGHIATCLDCGKKLNECPICRQYVTRVVRTFKA